MKRVIVIIGMVLLIYVIMIGSALIMRGKVQHIEGDLNNDGVVDIIDLSYAKLNIYEAQQEYDMITAIIWEGDNE